MYSYWPLHTMRVAGRERAPCRRPSAAHRARSCRCRGPRRPRTPTPSASRPRCARPSGRPPAGSSRPGRAAPARRRPRHRAARIAVPIAHPPAAVRAPLAPATSWLTGTSTDAEPLRRVAQLLRIADAHAVALAPLDRLRDRHAADRRRDHRLHVADVEAVARRRRAVDVDVQVVAGHRPLGEGAARAGHRLHRAARPRLPMRSSSARSGPKILMPTGVRMPVASMSMRPLIGIVHAFVTPGMRTAESIAATSRVVRQPGAPLALRASA